MESTRPPTLRLVPLLPPHFQRVLIYGAYTGLFGGLLKARGVLEVHAVETGGTPLEVVRHVLDSAHDSAAAAAAAVRGNQLDVLLLLDPAVNASALETMGPLLGAHGLVAAALPPGADEMAVTAVCAAHGFLLFNRAEVEGAGALLIFVPASYDPLAHAQQFTTSGRPDLAFEVLAAIPESYLRNPETRTNLRAEMLLCLVHSIQRLPESEKPACCARARFLFNEIVQLSPGFAPAYQCMAECWRAIGREDLAARLLRSLLAVRPESTVERQLRGYRAPRVARAHALPPDWTGAPPRVLFLIHPRPHYGLDVLYDGLVRLLGEERVLDYPAKPTLHGGTPDTLEHYPCNFDHPGAPRRLEDVLDLLRSRAFDLVLYGDCEGAIDKADTLRILEAAGSTPIVLVDQTDEFIDMSAPVSARLNGYRFAACAKREMLACVAYAPGTFPLPFAYPDARFAEAPAERPDRPVFWAGHRGSGLRAPCIAAAERITGLDLSAVYPQERYLAELRRSSIALNFFGFGFDTVRYWEIPAQGALLLTERLPIEVPLDFEDQVDAVLFDDLSEFERKLQRLLLDPDEAAAIARRGFDHARRHHASSARARHLLGWIQRLA